MKTTLLSTNNIMKGILALFVCITMVSCKSDPKVDPDKGGEDEGGSYSYQDIEEAYFVVAA